jgi:hypothetical protein
MDCAEWSGTLQFISGTYVISRGLPGVPITTCEKLFRAGSFTSTGAFMVIPPFGPYITLIMGVRQSKAMAELARMQKTDMWCALLFGF